MLCLAKITGGTSGIGLELAQQLCQNNTIIITGRDQNRLNLAKTKLGSVHTIQSDVSDPDAIAALYKDVTREFPGLNILINNAGSCVKSAGLSNVLKLLVEPHRASFRRQYARKGHHSFPRQDAGGSKDVTGAGLQHASADTAQGSGTGSVESAPEFALRMIPTCRLQRTHPVVEAG
jgi:NAD(P)-dependent dehydrogenase (short-subunit alcohol dehydrogenase family)